MRLIDAEELKRSIAVSALIEDRKTLEQIIDEQPTIEERKRGEWRHKSEKLAPLNTVWWYECSVCGYHAFSDMTTDYCPNCGADMRGEQE